MGRIMMNGIQYGTGGRPTAEGVTYDNAESGMTATNVQGALDELSNDLTIESMSYSYAGGTVYFKRVGNVKTVYLQIDPSSTISVGTTWFTLPEQFRPIPANGNNIVDFTCFQTSGTFSGILRLNGNTGGVTNEFIAFKTGAVRSTFTYI